MASSLTGNAFAGGLVLALLMACGTGADREHEARLCGRVLREFAPCVMYLSGRTPEAGPAAACCSGIDCLNQRVKSIKYGPRRFCQCIEDSTDVMKVGMDPTRIQSLQQECHLHLSFPISVSMNCSKV